MMSTAAASSWQGGAQKGFALETDGNLVNGLQLHLETQMTTNAHHLPTFSLNGDLLNTCQI